MKLTTDEINAERNRKMVYPQGMNFPRPKWYVESRAAAKKTGGCVVCSKELPSKRMSYCGFDCKIWVRLTAISSMEVSTLRRWIHKRFGFECQQCGRKFFTESKSGVLFPVFGGEVHHIVPLQYGGKHEWDNLTLLCVRCHKAVHGGGK